MKKTLKNDPEIFKLIFKIAVFFTLIFLVITIILSCFESLNPQQEDLFDACNTAWKIGFFTILALLGGKTLLNADQ